MSAYWRILAAVLVLIGCAGCERAVIDHVEFGPAFAATERCVLGSYPMFIGKVVIFQSIYGDRPVMARDRVETYHLAESPDQQRRRVVRETISVEGGCS